MEANLTIKSNFAYSGLNELRQSSTSTAELEPSFESTTPKEMVISDTSVSFTDKDVASDMLYQYVEMVNQAWKPSFFRLNFSIHDETNKIITQAIDTNTGEIIREIPLESRLDALARIQEFAGLLFDEKS